jgi:hypothetical protein
MENVISNKTVSNIEMRKGMVLLSCHANIKEMLLIGNIENLALEYNPMRPSNWNKIVVEAIGKGVDDIIDIKIGDEVVISEILRTYSVTIPTNELSMVNVSTKCRNIPKGQNDFNREHTVVEYIIGNADIIMFKWMLYQIK